MLNKRLMTKLLFFFLVGIVSSFPAAAQPTSQPSKELDKIMQLEIIDSVASIYNRLYVFEDVAKKIDTHLHDQYEKGSYKDITSPKSFVWTLQEDMRAVSSDLHIRVLYLSDEYFKTLSNGEPTEEEIKKKDQENRRRNYDFEEVKRLPGNVGYIKFNTFPDPRYAGPTAIAALNFLGNSEAIIIDLRDNGGGSPLMVELLASYFFDEATHINSLVSRGEGKVHQLWTHDYVSGPRLSGIDTYILISYDTFSAGEALAYHLQQAGKAIIVGDSTAGGAHNSKFVDIEHLNIVVKVPYQRAVNTFSGTNWEGVGLKPDIVVPSYKSFDVAYLDAVKRIREKCDDEEFMARLDWILPALETNVNPTFVDEEALISYAGQYGPIKIFYANSSLYFEYVDRRQMKMYPMSKTKFRCGVFDEYQIEFQLDENGIPNAGTISFEDGTVFKETKK